MTVLFSVRYSAHRVPAPAGNRAEIGTLAACSISFEFLDSGRWVVQRPNGEGDPFLSGPPGPYLNASNSLRTKRDPFLPQACN